MFVAQETASGRAVVVNVIVPALADGMSAERFAREVKFAARLRFDALRGDPRADPIMASIER